MVTRGPIEAGRTLVKGESNLTVLHEKNAHAPESFRVLGIPGQLHATMKEPIKQMGYGYAESKATRRYPAILEELNRRYGKDYNVTDPLIQWQIQEEAYAHAKGQIFMQKNVGSDWFRQATRRRVDPETGHASGPQIAKQLAADTLVPVKGVPANIVGEIFESATGLFTGSIRARRAFRKGIEKLTPQEADIIMRKMSNGLVGSSVIAVVVLTGGAWVGGMYRRGEKRKPEDLGPGEIAVGDEKVSKDWTHAPLFELAKLTKGYLDASQSKVRKTDTEPRGAIAGATEAGIELVKGIPFVGEMTRIAEGFNPANQDRFMGDFAKTLTEPRILQQIAEWTDKDTSGNTTKRDSHGIVEHLKSGIPGLRQSVPENQPKTPLIKPAPKYKTYKYKP